jgi:large subunit ribosomal protein L20
MARVKRGPHRKDKRKKILKLAKGFYGTKSNAYRIAQQAVDRALRFAYRDRRQKKRQFRSLWIVRINAAARENGLSYNRLISGLRQAGLDLNRKVLSDIAIHDPEGFAAVVEVAKEALADEAGVKIRPSRPISKRPERASEPGQTDAKKARRKGAPGEAEAEAAPKPAKKVKKAKPKAAAEAEPKAEPKPKDKAEPKPEKKAEAAPAPKAEAPEAAEKPAKPAAPTKTKAAAPTKTKTELQAMTVAELWELAESRGIAKESIEGSGANGNVVKADLVRTLVE